MPARDVANAVIGFEQALQVAAAALWGRRERATGRRGRTPEEATRLRWTSSVKRGSVRIPLALPGAAEEDDHLDISVPTLGESALAQTLRLIDGSNDGPAEVAQALTRWSAKLGQRYVVEFRGPAVGDPVRFDELARRRIAEIATRPVRDPESGVVAGILYEANFEELEARVRSADGASATVFFDEQHADEIQEALRSPATIEGEVIVDPVTLGVRSIQLRSVSRPQQLGLHLHSAFGSHRTVNELAQDQGVPPFSIDELPTFEMDDDEFAAFVTAIDG